MSPRHQSEITKLQKHKAVETKKAADFGKKAATAQLAANRATVLSQVETKLRDVNRYRDEQNRAEAKAADYDQKIAREHDRLANAQLRLDREEAAERRKHQQDRDRREQEQGRLQREQDRRNREIITVCCPESTPTLAHNPVPESARDSSVAAGMRMMAASCAPGIRSGASARLGFSPSHHCQSSHRSLPGWPQTEATSLGHWSRTIQIHNFNRKGDVVCTDMV